MLDRRQSVVEHHGGQEGALARTCLHCCLSCIGLQGNSRMVPQHQQLPLRPAPHQRPWSRRLRPQLRVSVPSFSFALPQGPMHRCVSALLRVFVWVLLSPDARAAHLLDISLPLGRT